MYSVGHALLVAGHLVATTLSRPLCRRPPCRRPTLSQATLSQGVKNFYADMESRKEAFCARSGFSGVIWFGCTLSKPPEEFTRIRENNKREKTLKNFIKKFLKKPLSRFTN
ncbi:unnamed protein product [Meloidogyne enterolobii]|uniref:Uncharacterized protein n=1 Tax=Meloidogyne enterolobii TaxID=390850 RepID=A0ACB0YLC1_MELEN